MKNIRYLTLSTCIFMLPLFVFGQPFFDTLRIPQDAYIFYILDSSHQFTALDIQKAHIESDEELKIRVFGMKKPRERNIIPGLHSSVQVSKEEARNLYLFIRMRNNKVNPQSFINAFKLNKDPNTKVRFIESQHVMFLDFSSSYINKQGFLLHFQNLSPGDYALILNSNRTSFYTFTVTP